jgi:hypothetical protein
MTFTTFVFLRFGTLPVSWLAVHSMRILYSLDYALGRTCRYNTDSFTVKGFHEIQTYTAASTLINLNIL